MLQQAEMDDVQSAVMEILETHAAKSEQTAMPPQQLVRLCEQRGGWDARRVDTAVVTLIDNDLVEYDMDDDNRVIKLWLL